MKADIPDKILINRGEDGKLHHSYWTTDQELVPFGDTLYIRKEALIEWAKSEMERLWELLPDADNPNPTQMELRYLGQYMQMEALEDKLNSM